MAKRTKFAATSTVRVGVASERSARVRVRTSIANLRQFLNGLRRLGTSRSLTAANLRYLPPDSAHCTRFVKYRTLRWIMATKKGFRLVTIQEVQRGAMDALGCLSQQRRSEVSSTRIFPKPGIEDSRYPLSEL